MSVAPRPARAFARPLEDLLNRLAAAVLVVSAGVLIGLQYIRPNKRVIAVLAATVLFGLSLRVGMVSGIGVLALALPYPRSTVFGSTNLAFVLLLLVIWLLRITQRQSPPPQRTAVDVPIIGMYAAYVLSFYNVEDVTFLTRALENFGLMVACALMFYLIVNSVRTERDLRRLHVFQAVSVLSVCLLVVYEVGHPGQPFIRGWIDFGHKSSVGVESSGMRVGSIFYDYELFSEYCALNLLLVVFLFVRAGSLLGKLAYGGLIVLIGFGLFATVTRGSIVALAITAPYFVWLLRRRVNLVSLVLYTVGIIAAFVTMNFIVAHYTQTGDLFARLSETKLVRGLPDSRAEAWPSSWKRLLEHPLIGHGPYYSSEHGLKQWTWPHNIFLYVGNNAGFIGLAFFLWLLWKLFRVSTPRVDDLRHPSYAQAFLLVAHTQMITFVVDQIKVEFLRNPIYQFQVWWMFATTVATYQITTRTGVAALPGPAVVPRRA